MGSYNKPSFIGQIVAIIILYLIVDHYFGCNSCNEKKQVNKPETNAVFQPTLIYTHEDTLKWIDELKSIDKKLDFWEANSNKAVHQYNRFWGYYQDGSGTEYDAYRAAEVAKKMFDNYDQAARNLRIPERMPKPLYDTMDLALGDIRSYYMTQYQAYDLVMSILNGDGNYKSVSEFKETTASAINDYQTGIYYLFIVESHLGMHPVHKGKKHKKSNLIYK